MKGSSKGGQTLHMGSWHATYCAAHLSVVPCQPSRPRASAPTSSSLCDSVSAVVRPRSLRLNLHRRQCLAGCHLHGACRLPPCFLRCILHLTKALYMYSSPVVHLGGSEDGWPLPTPLHIGTLLAGESQCRVQPSRFPAPCFAARSFQTDNDDFDDLHRG